MTTDPGPFQIGDHVTAGYRMAGCERQSVEGNGRITTIWDNVIEEPHPVPALALVTFDEPMPVPCDNPDHDHEPYPGVSIALNGDLTQVVYDHNRMALIQAAPS